MRVKSYKVESCSNNKNNPVTLVITPLAICRSVFLNVWHLTLAIFSWV